MEGRKVHNKSKPEVFKPEGCMKIPLSPILRVSNWLCLGYRPPSVFLTSSQVLMLLVVWELPFGKHNLEQPGTGRLFAKVRGFCR